MSLNEATLTRQLGRAKEDLFAWNKALEKSGVPSAERRKNAKWRHLNAACNTIRNRLKAVEAIKIRDEEAVRHKAEKIAAAAAEKAEPKKSAKQPKVAAKGAAGGKKEKSAEPKEKKKKEEKKEE
ncbi:MAG TPA: hypothetical protein VEI07_19345 [Planctomycetaceae bacterium]|nr:hypothetical protein [Planctomycetaceae bacterium]